jgi:glycosyltransferase involved in cell wall biosynthesis
MHIKSTKHFGTNNSIKTRKKIAIFSGFYLPFLGGIERYTNKLSTELIKLGYDVVVVATNHANLPSYEHSYDHLKIYRLPTYELFKNRYPIVKRNREFRGLMDQFENEKVDYVICNTRFQLTTLLGAKYAKTNHKQSLVIDHGSSHFSVDIKFLDELGKVYEHYLTDLVKRMVKDYYGVSQRCNQWLEHFHIKARGVFYNSVDSDTYDRFKSKAYKKDFGNKLVITYAGRIIREKGVEMLLEAFSDLAPNYKNVVLVIAGDGPLLSTLRDKYKHSRIFFEGKLDYDEMMSLFNVTDIFCYPSMYPEGLPTSILEAGIMKCAVIATDRGGTKEVIIGSEYGIIIDENQDSLTNALKDLLNKPSYVEDLKNNLHKRVKNYFTWKTTAAKVSQVLKEMQ